VTPSVISGAATANAGDYRRSGTRRVDHSRVRRGDRNRQAGCGKAERYHELPGLQL